MMGQVFLSAMQTQERHHPCSRLRCKFFPRLCQFFQPQIYLGNVTQRRRVKKRFLHLQWQNTQETLRIEWDFRSVCELDPRMVTPFITGTYPGDGMCLLYIKQRYYYAVYDHVGQVYLNKRCWNPKENWRWPCIFRVNVSIWDRNTSVLGGILCRLRSLRSLTAGVEEKFSDRSNHMKNRRAKRKNFSDFPPNSISMY